jgi:NADPH-dependent glutamate synthase beta subunit-like oxidoreductase
MPEQRAREATAAPQGGANGKDDLVHGVPPIAVSSTTTMANRTGSWKYIRPIYQDKIAPCNANCPVGIDLEGAMNLLRQGRVDEAKSLVLRENPLPGVTGRLCERPCELACNRAQYDEAVSIHAVERMLGDHGPEIYEDPPRARGEKVAIVGSGPAGLACAWHLARLGYAVDVFEAEAEPGGRLRWEVPEYRLPREVLKREIDRIRALGVTLRTGTRVGVDVLWQELGMYDAVFLAGAPRRVAPIDLPGTADVEGVCAGRAFLRSTCEKKAPLLCRRVTVLGAGDLAVDCARSAVRRGGKVTVVSDRPFAALTANPDAVKEAFREGVRFVFDARPLAARTSDDPPDDWDGTIEPADVLQADGYGVRPRLVGVQFARLGPGSTGAAGGTAGPGERFFQPTDVLIDARPETAELTSLPAELTRAGGVIATDAFGRTSREGYFAGGEAAGQGATVAQALGSGKRAAIGIDRLLRTRAGEPVPALDAEALRYGGTGNMSMTRWRGDDPVFRTNELNQVVTFELLNMAHFARVPAHIDRHLDVDHRGFGWAETNLGLTHKQALDEAARCFNCGVCNECELCMIFCPDVAIKKQSQGFSLSYKYCKGCGVCVEECPRGAMTMTREGL